VSRLCNVARFIRAFLHPRVQSACDWTSALVRYRPRCFCCAVIVESVLHALYHWLAL
jgi:hypothetical protein